MLVKADFDSPYDDADPWGYRASWYEQRRRQLMLACLPRKRFANALELGCANGVVTAALATRADAVLALDQSQRALDAARQACTAPHIRFERRLLPASWPPGRFDLVVVADMGYYLNAAELRALCDKLGASLTSDGCVLLAHWRHDIACARQSAQSVHQIMRAQLALHKLAKYADADLYIDVLTTRTLSVAQTEGLA